MMWKCGRRHTVINLSISTLGFNYIADAHTIPPPIPPFAENPDNCGVVLSATDMQGSVTKLYLYISFFNNLYLVFNVDNTSAKQSPQ